MQITLREYLRCTIRQRTQYTQYLKRLNATLYIILLVDGIYNTRCAKSERKLNGAARRLQPTQEKWLQNTVQKGSSSYQLRVYDYDEYTLLYILSRFSEEPWAEKVESSKVLNINVST